MNGNAKAYEVVTDRICNMLESGVIPWRMTWAKGNGAEIALGRHRNAQSGHVYRGTNALLTYAAAHALGFERGLWLTFKQALDMGGNVRKGEKGLPIIYASRFTVTEQSSEGEELERSIPFLKVSYVFNVAQCDGIELEPIPAPTRYEFSTIDECERIVASMPKRPPIGHSSTIATPCYFSARDEVVMPDRERFESPEFYYTGLFHELAHSTKHPSRLDRKADDTDKAAAGRPCREAYAREELVAEMTAAFLCAIAGIDQATVTDSAAYVGNWLTALRNDKKMLVSAAAHAQRAADFILNVNASADAGKAAA